MFRHLDITRIWYYRLLGAKIGKGVTIEKGTTLGEYDLLDIGDNVHLNHCTCRPFAAERNTSMYLGKIFIGKNSSIGLKSHVAAGSVLPEDTFIGANSSSYEINATDSADRIFFKPPRPHILLQIFGIIPIKVVVLFISSLPWMAGLWGIVSTESEADTNNVKTIISWWATPRRIMYHYIAQSLHVSVRPMVWILLVIVIKRVLTLVFGPAKVKSRDERTQRDKYRTHLMSELVPNGSIKSFTKLFGTHYEVTSIAVRALGAKVGKRVYWPGTGPSIQDFDLVEIGDDVVFGSRSHITTSDAFGSAPVRVGNSAMIADRVVLSPGTCVGDRTVLGSGAFIKRNQHCFPDTVWVGNRKGSALCLSSTGSNVTSRVPTLLNSRAPTLMNASDSEYSEKSSINKDTPFISQGTSIVESPRSSIDLGIGFGNFFESGLEKCFESGLEKGIKKGLEKGFKPSPKVKISAKTRTLTFDSLDSPNGSNRSFVLEKDLEKGDGIKTHISEKSRTNTSTTFGTVSTVTFDSPDSGSSTPFGRAFYEGKAPYWVLGQFPIFLYSTFTTIFVQIYWNVGTITTIMLSQIMNRTDEFHPHWYRPIKIYAVDVALLSGMYLCLSLIALTVCITAKWLLLGRRKKGSYDWDKSSYCQRWQIFLTIEAIRRRSFSGNGVLGMLTGTYWCALYFRLLGAKIGRDCALFAGGRPSLVFTEPDLLELGERVTTDDASLVCHINSRGNFSLNELKVGARSVLRSGSRLLSGARMGSDTVLLEHTLIMAGDEADEGTCYQGWPADVYRGKRLTGL
jgi:acetyltransferase-like isoleucine patch superfamily enzyme